MLSITHDHAWLTILLMCIRRSLSSYFILVSDEKLLVLTNYEPLFHGRSWLELWAWLWLCRNAASCLDVGTRNHSLQVEQCHLQPLLVINELILTLATTTTCPYVPEDICELSFGTAYKRPSLMYPPRSFTEESDPFLEEEGTKRFSSTCSHAPHLDRRPAGLHLAFLPGIFPRVLNCGRAQRCGNWTQDELSIVIFVCVWERLFRDWDWSKSRSFW